MLLENLKVGTRLAIGFGSTLVLMLLVVAMGYYGLSVVSNTAGVIIIEDEPLVELAYQANINFLELRRFEKDLFINIESPEERQNYWAKWQNAKQRASSTLNTLQNQVKTQAHKDLVTMIRTNLDHYYSGVEKIEAAINLGEIATAQQANSALKPYKNAIHDADEGTLKIVSSITQLMSENKSLIQTVYSNTLSRMLTFSLVSALLVSIMTVGFTRSITQPIRNIVEAIKIITQGDLTYHIEDKRQDELGEICHQFNAFTQKFRNIIAITIEDAARLSASAKVLLEASKEQSDGAGSVADQTNSVACADEEMAVTSNEIAKNCLAVADSAQKASASVDEGAKVIHAVITAMDNISGHVNTAANTVKQLGSRSDQIGQIVGTIGNIANQTNLLALNAAIEAARAGEQGRGFAVVADEVRALAERTTNATREIDDMIKSVQSETNAAVAIIEAGTQEVKNSADAATRSDQALKAIVAQIDNLSMQTHLIASAAEQQTLTTQDISNSMQKISTFAKRDVDNAERTKFAAKELTDLAERLNKAVSQFKVV